MSDSVDSQARQQIDALNSRIDVLESAQFAAEVSSELEGSGQANDPITAIDVGSGLSMSRNGGTVYITAQPTIEVFYATASGQHQITTTARAIDWIETTSKKDSPFSIDLSAVVKPTVINLTKAGRYWVMANMTWFFDKDSTGNLDFSEQNVSIFIADGGIEGDDDGTKIGKMESRNSIITVAYHNLNFSAQSHSDHGSGNTGSAGDPAHTHTTPSLTHDQNHAGNLVHYLANASHDTAGTDGLFKQYQSLYVSGIIDVVDDAPDRRIEIYHEANVAVPASYGRVVDPDRTHVIIIRFP